MSTVSRLGLFGGTFNPPHLAHLAIAEAMGDALGLEQVLWMPAAASPFKVGDPAAVSAEHRLAMVRLATADNPRFAVSDLELRRAGVSYTVDTVEALREAQPDRALTLLLGGDSLASFTRWHRWEDLLATVRIAVYARPGSTLADLPEAVRARTTFVEAPALDLSSTVLRKRLMEGQTIRYLVPEALRSYIAQHGLYQKRATA